MNDFEIKTIIKQEIAAQLAEIKQMSFPIGGILTFSSLKVPDDFMPCVGQELLISQYPELFTVIGTTFGGDNNRTFCLPDLQGQFVRGWDKDGDVDVERTFGAKQEDAIQGHSHANRCMSSGSHTHRFMTQCHNVSQARFTKGEYIAECIEYDKTLEIGFDCDELKTSVTKGHSHEIQVSEPTDDKYGRIRVDTETRPKNIALLYCIKVK